MSSDATYRNEMYKISCVFCDDMLTQENFFFFFNYYFYFLWGGGGRRGDKIILKYHNFS